MPQFHEVQYVRQNRLFHVIWIAVIIMWILFIQQIIFGQTVGNQPAPDWFVILLWFLIGIGLPAVMWTARMVVDVTDKHVTIQYQPIVKKVIEMHQIDAVEATTYRPIREYGGWGMIWLWNNVRAYTVVGNEGVMLTMTDGKRILIGSQQADDLATAIQQNLR